MKSTATLALVAVLCFVSFAPATDITFSVTASPDGKTLILTPQLPAGTGGLLRLTTSGPNAGGGILVTATGGSPAILDFAVQATLGGIGPTPPTPPSPTDLSAAAQALALAEAKKLSDPKTADVLAAMCDKLAARIGVDIKTPEQLIVANKFARTSLLDPTTLAKWDPWVQALGTWLDARIKDGSLKTLDQFKAVWIAMGSGLRGAAK